MISNCGSRGPAGKSAEGRIRSLEPAIRIEIPPCVSPNSKAARLSGRASRTILLLVLLNLGLVTRAATGQDLVGPYDWSVFRPGANTRYVLRDLTGDGAPDLLYGGPLGSGPVTTPQLSGMTLFPNIGDGRAGDPVFALLPTHLQSTRRGAQTPVVIDLNGDGYEDVVSPTRRDFVSGVNCPCEVVCYFADGMGGYRLESAPHITERTMSGFASSGVADVDGDGDYDLVFSTYDPQGYSLVLINDGAGHMSADPIRLPANAPSFEQIRFADFDGDGYPDLLGVTGGRSAPSVVWMNDRAGHFGPGRFQLPSASRWLAEVLDINGDGHLDMLFGVAWTTAQPRQLEVWINDGTGVFQDESSRIQYSWAVPNGPRHIDVADFDADGDLDLFVHVDTSAGTLLLNDGTGHFTDGSPHIANTAALASARMLDMDRDGDADMLGWVRSGWFANTTRQILAPDPPVGSPLQVEIHAPVGHLVTYAISLIHRDAYLPGLGWFALDPATAIAWPSVAQVPASRIVTSTIPLPNDPSLAGTELYLQAVDVDPSNVARLSNFWTATIR